MMRSLRNTLAGLALLALFVPGLQAQTTFGLRGGISVAGASLDADVTFDESNRTGYVAGIFLDYASNGLLGFQIAAQYTQKGVELDLGAATSEFDLAYLEIPAVLKLGLPLGPIRPSVFGGAALSFKAGCDVDGDDCADELSGTDFSGVLGADLAIHLGGLSLWADARYSVGLQNVSEAEDVISDLKNRNWTLQVGIGF